MRHWSWKNSQGLGCKKIRAIVQCFHCEKARCIYAALQQKMESVSYRFSCGDLFFRVSHLNKVILKRRNLTCESPIEKGYCNNMDRILKLKQICYHCGESGSTCFVFWVDQLREKAWRMNICISSSISICTDCIENGKDVVKQGKQDKMQARKEKEAKEKEETVTREKVTEARGQCAMLGWLTHHK